jgi:phosphatidate cytidylyltransferase
LRVFSALVLVPIAIGTAYVGGWIFAILWSIAAVIVLWEWICLVLPENRRPVLLVGAIALGLSLALAGAAYLTAASAAIVIGMLAGAVLAPAERRAWVAAGLPYAGAIGIAPIVIRSDSDHGFVAMVFLFAIVWATDIVAYFVGRAVGGPKLLQRISPKKTWSGALGGLAGAILAALAIGASTSVQNLFAISLVGALLSIISQAGDLFESYIKRRFGAKDSSHLVPGHGGLMDRLDGFVAAALLAAVIGMVRGGVGAPGRGLLVW